MANDTSRLRIAVIGAGPAGLTFASVLHHQFYTNPVDRFQPKITVFERDTSRAARDLGGSLDMHWETGQRVLKAAGLWEEFQKVARYEGDNMKIVDKLGKVWMSDDQMPGPTLDPETAGPDPHATSEQPTEVGGGPDDTPASHGLEREAEGRPEIDRGILNALFIDSLPEGVIQWGKTVSCVEPHGDDMHSLTFSDGTTEEFDLVIGGDGAWSKTRKLLSPVVPFYCGVIMIEVRLSGVDSRIPEIGKYVGPGTVMACGDNKGIFAQRNAGERVRVYFALRVPEAWPQECGIDWSSVKAARPGLRKQFEGWDQKLLDFLELADEPSDAPRIAMRPLYMLPPENFKWEHKCGITLIGDSAHLMTPFAGEGANQAMADGTELAEAIIAAFRSGTSTPQPTVTLLDTAVQAYEKKMFPRAEANMRDTFSSLNAFMHPNSPQSAFDFMMQMMAQNGPGQPSDA